MLDIVTWVETYPGLAVVTAERRIRLVSIYRGISRTYVMQAAARPGEGETALLLKPVTRALRISAGDIPAPA